MLETRDDMTDRKKGAVAKRLRFLREKLGYWKPGRFADYLGISPARWRDVENGFTLSREMAFLLKKKIAGITLDWIYFGEAAGLSTHMARNLGELPPGADNALPRI